MAYNLSRLSVLVVEDNLFMRQLMRGVLSSLGVRNIKECVDGEDALSALRTWQPDIAFVDWEMEPMNGLEFTRQVRQNDNHFLRFLPIVMFSSYTTLDRITTARDSGVTEFLAKPVSPTAVYARIVMTIEKPRNFVKVGDYFGPDRRRKIEEMAGDERRRTESDFVTAASLAAEGQSSKAGKSKNDDTEGVDGDKKTDD